MSEELNGEGRTRKRFNTVIEGRVYQRGQILTWTRAEKMAALATLKINTVVNLWPKIDPDLSELKGLYLFLPAERSVETLEPRVRIMAEGLANLLLRDLTSTALVLCEAGKTRSVFFCALLIHHMERVPLDEAMRRAQQAVPANDLKGFMVDYLTTPAAPVRRRQPI